MSDRRAHAHFTDPLGRGNISLWQSHDSCDASFNAFSGDTTRIYVNNSSPQPPPPPPSYQPRPTSSEPTKDPRPYDPLEGYSPLHKSLIYVFDYVMNSLIDFEFEHSEKQTPEESQRGPKRTRLVFWLPLTLRVIWELIPIALLLYWGTPPPPSQILQPSVYINFFVGVSFTFLWQFAVGYCTIYWFTVGFPLGLVLYGHGRLANAIYAGKRSLDLSQGYQYQAIHGFYRGQQHSRLFAVYSCFSLLCGAYAYWGSFRYLLPVLVPVHL